MAKSNGASVAAAGGDVRRKPVDDPKKKRKKQRKAREGIRAAWADWVRRTGLWMLLMGAVLVVLLASIAFSDDSRLFALKVIAAAVMASIPGWLYLQFIENKGVSLYDEYVLNLFRLRIDEYKNLPAPPEHTGYFKPWEKDHATLGTKSKDNLYRRKFEAVYGRNAVSTFDKIYDRRRLRDKTETYSPVLLATLLLSLGWVLVLPPEPLGSLGGVESSTFPELPYAALQFGFFGSYFFILQDLLRRYFREDLKTAAYISASARIVFVAVMVIAIDAAWEDAFGKQEALAFLIGMFPEVGVQFLRGVVAIPLRRTIPSLKKDHPLSDLDGLNTWYEARLVEEGIEDIQNLTTANLVDLLLRSRVPVSRVIDWLDQGFLHLHLPPDDDNAAWRRLHKTGVRSATDLERAWGRQRDEPAFREVIAEVFGDTGDTSKAVARIDAIVTSLQSEVNLNHVRAFKRYEWLEDAEPEGDETVAETPPPPAPDVTTLPEPVGAAG